MIDFDWTISFSDILIFGGGLIAFLKTFVTVRDSLRDLLFAVGKEHPPSGILGDLHHVKRELRRHRDWLVANGFVDQVDR
jgi:hypothetical protein